MIKKALWIIIITFSTVIPCQAKSHSILLLGDSLSAAYNLPVTKGWVSLLNKRYNEQKSSINITNASISGETTAGGLTRLPRLLDSNKVDLLIIELGANDGLRGYPPKKIFNNLLQIIELAKAKGIDVALFDIKILPNYGPRYNDMFSKVFTQVAEQENVPLIPFFMEEVVKNPTLMQRDGLHPNESAQPLIRDIVEKNINKLLNVSTL